MTSRFQKQECVQAVSGEVRRRLCHVRAYPQII